MKLTIENASVREIDTSENLTESLALVDESRAKFAILENTDGQFIQTSNDGSSYVIEKQTGSLTEHFEAVRFSSDSSYRTQKPLWKRILSSSPQEKFDLSTVIACFEAFLGKRPKPTHIYWRKLNL